jgi:dTDP-4-dehydrorhamnose reductase
MRVLVTGGSGYLGQFLVLGLTARGHQVAFTYCTADPQLPVGTPHRVDLATGEGLAACVAAAGPLDAVINCAAVSQPAACERDPAAAHALNVPSQLLDALAAAAPAALLIHVSTDQVYDGSRAFWREQDDGCTPVNAYGASKRAAEAAVRARWPARHAILRSSIILGPQPPAPVGRPLFLQWLDGALAADAGVELFEDEFRSPVDVADLVAACAALLARDAGAGSLTLNLGGPERCAVRERCAARRLRPRCAATRRTRPEAGAALAQAVARGHGRRGGCAARVPARARAPRALSLRAAPRGQPGGHQHGCQPRAGGAGPASHALCRSRAARVWARRGRSTGRSAAAVKEPPTAYTPARGARCVLLRGGARRHHCGAKRRASAQAQRYPHWAQPWHAHARCQRTRFGKVSRIVSSTGCASSTSVAMAARMTST